MNRTPERIRAQELIGRMVKTADGHNLGRVYDIEAGRSGGELRVVALLTGPRAWLTRFGWSRQEHGKRVPWKQIDQLSPVITLRSEHQD